VIWELTAKHPVVDLSLFGRRNFAVGVTALSLGMLAFFGINVVFPLWLQTTLGYTSTWAGLATAPVGILAFIVSPFIGKNIQRLELRAVVTFAFMVFAFTSFWFAGFNSGASFAALVLPRFIMGIAIACFFIPLQPDLPVRPQPGPDRRCLGSGEFLPHPGLQCVHRADRDALDAPW